jgi:hypothetical protein
MFFLHYAFGMKTESMAAAFRLFRKRFETSHGMILPVSKAPDLLDFPALDRK